MNTLGVLLLVLVARRYEAIVLCILREYSRSISRVVLLLSRIVIISTINLVKISPYSAGTAPASSPSPSISASSLRWVSAASSILYVVLVSLDASHCCLDLAVNSSY